MRLFYLIDLTNHSKCREYRSSLKTLLSGRKGKSKTLLSVTALAREFLTRAENGSAVFGPARPVDHQCPGQPYPGLTSCLK
jgi:hypothetical protein